MTLTEKSVSTWSVDGNVATDLLESALGEIFAVTVSPSGDWPTKFSALTEYV